VNRRVVFDTSTLVSAALRIGSVPHQALLVALAMYDLCASTETLHELERVLTSRKFDRYLDRTTREEFVAFLYRHVHLFALRPAEIEAVEPRCRDPKDHQFLALAPVAEAGILVSSDSDLLTLNPRHNVEIVRPSEFLAWNQPR